MKKAIVIIFFLASIFSMFAQTYQLIDINTDKFPVIEANFLANGIEYNNNSLGKSDFEVNEGNSILPIIEVKIPKTTVIPSSVVLVLDVSSSMNGARFEALKATACEFVNMLPTEVTEVAIASFNNYVMLNSDFSHNKTDLINTINKIKLGGGTSYDNAFLTPVNGALHVASTGKYRRVIVFITDGLSEVKEYVVTNAANEDSISISSITIGLPISDKLKYITKGTGGSYFSNLTRQSEISNALKKIYTQVQTNAIGKVKWVANHSCLNNQSYKLHIENQVFDIEYDIPDKKRGAIEVSSSDIYFDQGKINKAQVSPLFIKGNNIELNITDIVSSNQKFGVQNSVFPIASKINEYKRVNLYFVPTDSIFSTTQFVIKNPGCPDIIVEGASSGTRKLLITSPTKGKRFNAGNNIPVKWKGIDKSTVVSFYYKTKNDANVKMLGSGNKYETNLPAPFINDSIQIIGMVTNQVTFPNLMNKKVVLLHNEPFKQAFYSPNGKQIITVSKNGTLISWNPKTGSKQFEYENKHLGNIAFLKDYNRLLSESGSYLNVYTNRNGLLITELNSINHKVKTAISYHNGNELYASLSIISKLAEYNLAGYADSYTEITGSAETKYTISYSPNNLLVKNELNKKYKYKIEHDNKFDHVVLHLQKPYAIIKYHNKTDLFNLKERIKVKVFYNETYIRFTKNGDYLLTNDSDKTYINDANTGERIYEIEKKSPMAINEESSQVAYCQNGFLVAGNLNKPEVLGQIKISDVQKIAFFPKSEKLLVLTTDSIKVWDYVLNKIEFSTFAESKLVNMMQVSPNENAVLITNDNLVALWPLENHFDSDSSDFVYVSIPKPEVASSLLFEEIYVGTSTDKVFPNAITNNTQSKIVIDTVYFESKGPFTLISPLQKEVINKGEKLAIELSFNPEEKGENFQKLIVESALSKFECIVSGTGITSEFTIITNEFNFGKKKVNSVSNATVPVLYNSGTEPMKNIKLTNWNSDAGFDLKTNSTSVLLPNDTLWCELQFKPKSRGKQSTYLLFESERKKQIVTQVYGEAMAKRALVIAGQVVNGGDKTPIQCKVVLTELNSGNKMGNFLTGASGNFNFKAQADLNYSVTAELPGYISSSINVDLRQPQTIDTIWLIVEMLPIINNSLVKLNNIFFEFGNDKLLAISIPEIARVANILTQQQAFKVEIHGHTDNIGSSESNLLLSKSRALEVKRLFTEMGVKQQRISTVFYGESKPISDNNTEEGRKANRRVEIKFIK